MISSQYPGEYHATAMYIYGVSGNTINEVSAVIGLERFRYLNAFVTCYSLNSISVCYSTKCLSPDVLFTPLLKCVDA